MQLICWDCQNYTYFEVDVETMKELKVNSACTVIEDAMFQDWNYSESMLRDNLNDIVAYVLKQDAGAIKIDHATGDYLNTYVSCGRCGSKKVTKPYSSWQHQHLSLEEELLKNKEEYSDLRKEHNIGHHLPVLWKE